MGRVKGPQTAPAVRGCGEKPEGRAPGRPPAVRRQGIENGKAIGSVKGPHVAPAGSPVMVASGPGMAPELGMAWQLVARRVLASTTWVATLRAPRGVSSSIVFRLFGGRAL